MVYHDYSMTTGIADWHCTGCNFQILDLVGDISSDFELDGDPEEATINGMPILYITGQGTHDESKVEIAVLMGLLWPLPLEDRVIGLVIIIDKAEFDNYEEALNAVIDSLKPLDDAKPLQESTTTHIEKRIEGDITIVK